jgi:methylthioribose-1-phosphate isomerase
MRHPTISWDDETDSILFIDQTRLPERFAIVQCESVDRLAEAIRRLEIRGAPALGVAGAYGVALAAERSTSTSFAGFLSDVSRAAEHLRATRPTAVNLGWGIDRVISVMKSALSVEEARARALREAEAIACEDVNLCHEIGRHGAELLPDRCTVLTHCNAGALACVEWGTALGVIRSAVQSGKQVRVVACETRPLNQGSRLTAWELKQESIPVEVTTDSTAAHLMRRGEIDAVVGGGARLCRAAGVNQIGTYMHAVCARHHHVPFYVAAPYSTFDLVSTEEDVTIEKRSREELALCGGRQLMPDGVPARNLAFDATPLDLVSAIITEKGVYRPPFSFERDLP